MLAFDEASHTYTWDGQIVPSVTTIIQPLNNFDGIPPGVLAEAARRGAAVHAATELIDSGELDTSADLGDIFPYVKAYQRWLSEMKPAILLSEQRVFNRQRRYAGTLDRVVAIDGQEYLIDIKTSTEISPTVGPQTAAYLEALNWGSDIRRAVLQLKSDGTYRWRELESAADWPTFVACLIVYNFRTGRSHV